MKIGYDAKRVFHNTTGLGNYGRDLIRILSGKFPQWQFLLYNPKTPAVDRLPARHNLKRIEPGFLHKKFPALWRYKWITSYIRRDHPDIFHGLSGELPSGISHTGIPSVVSIHDLIFLRYPHWYNPVDRMIYKWKFMQAVRQADQIVAISHQTARDIVEFGKVSPGRIRVIYQGCNDVFKKDYSKRELEGTRLKFGLPDCFALYVGTIEPRKNAFTIVKALHGTDIPLVMVGREKKPYAKEIREFIARNRMENQIVFLKGLQQVELAHLYRMAKVFVYPSVYEGFGIPLIEALFSRTPVITNASGVFPEAAGEAGIYLDDIFDEFEMRGKLIDACSGSHDDQVRKGYEYAVAHFSDEVIARSWKEVYESLR
jgi:glycosyltransferase involved in cell wall biosynthesis